VDEKTNHQCETVKTSFICNTETTKSAKSTDCISGLESRNVTSWLHALTTDSGKWLDVYIDDAHKV